MKAIMEENRNIGFKQMIILIDAEMQKDIKSRALFKNITLKKWVLQAIVEKMIQEDKAK